VLSRLGMRLGPWLLVGLAFLAMGAGAKEAVPASDDPALEARVLAIAEELRCLVCQNETIAASHADLAEDLRKQIRQKLKAGQSKEQIIDFMVARYGDFVLYRPPLKPTTVLLWVGPFALLVLAATVLAVNIRRRRASVQPEELSAEQAERARALLDELPRKP
jgi:cytochrome c-type biogenesis protein CcmH